MKLYQVPNKSFINLSLEDKSIILFFHHIDGSYSLCFTKDNEIIHLSAFIDVEIVEKPLDWKNNVI